MTEQEAYAKNVRFITTDTTITNTQYIFSNDIWIINSGITITIADTGSLRMIGGGINSNGGIVDNYGIISRSNGGFINNNGGSTINNYGDIYHANAFGAINNQGTINNYGFFDNAGYLSHYGGNINNYGLLKNTGGWIQLTGGNINNYGTLDNSGSYIYSPSRPPSGIVYNSCSGIIIPDPLNTNVNFTQETPCDTTSPLITIPENITSEATGPNGVIVDYVVTATDDSEPVTLSCDLVSGTIFSLGTTTVTCTATDSFNNEATEMFDVTVQDTTEPILSGVPTNATVEATGPTGATFDFTTPTATDLVDPNPIVSCDSISGSTFALGDNTVTCTATDSFNNKTNAQFTVTVEDTTVPLITLTGEPVIELLIGESYVDAGATASDFVDDDTLLTAAIVNVNPVDVLVPAQYTITYNVSDNAGNPAVQVTRIVTVLTQDQAVDNITQDITDAINSGDIGSNGGALLAKLDQIMNKLDSGNTNSACNQIGSFINQLDGIINNGTPEEIAAVQPILDAANGIQISYC